MGRPRPPGGLVVATARVGGEPAWHRRQRRARAQARTLVRVAAAKSILASHHSSQKIAATCNHYVGLSDVQDMARDETEFAAGASRHPYWSCGCGTADNWGDRRRCRSCKRDAPFSVRKRQIEQGGGGGKSSKSGAGNGGGGGKSKPTNGGGGGGAAGPGGKGPNASHGAPARASGRSYADAAREARSSDKFAAKVAELERSNERLLRQLADLRSKGGGTDGDAEMEDDADDHEREDRIKTLTANLRAVAAVYGEASAEHRACKEELEGLLRARREERPLQVQLQNVDRRIERQKQKADRLEEQVTDLREKAAALREELENTEKGLAEARAGLADLEDERKAVLLREAQAAKLQEEGKQAGDPERGQQLDEHGTWSRMVDFIRQRSSQPGVDPQLTVQLASVVQMLQALCGQLPAPPVQPAHAAPSTTTDAPQGGMQVPGDQPANSPLVSPFTSSAAPRPPGNGGGTDGGPAGNTTGETPTQDGASTVEQVSADKPIGPGGVDGVGTAASATGGGSSSTDDGAMEVEDVIKLLPQRHRTRVREALRRGDEQEGMAESGGRSRDRERSPRPTKTGGDAEL